MSQGGALPAANPARLRDHRPASSIARRVERVSLKEAALGILRAMILAGELPARTQIDIDALCVALDVSERPLREALLVLESQGYVVVAPRRGTFVAEITRQDVVDRLEMVAILAGLAAERAAGRTPLPIEGLAQATDVVRREPQSPQAWVGFLRGLGAASGSRRVADELDAALAGLGNLVVPKMKVGRISSSALAARVVEAVAATEVGVAGEMATRLVMASQGGLLDRLSPVVVEQSQEGEASLVPETPVRPAKLGVIAYLREQIFYGSLRAGERLDVEALGATLGMSRSPIREALIVLEQEGLIRTAANRGTFINTFTPTDVEDHFEIFARLLEAGALRAMAALTGDSVVLLRVLREQLRGASGPELSEAAFLFHRTAQRAGTSSWRRRDQRRLVQTLPNWLTDPSIDDQTWRWFQRFLDDVLAAVARKDAAALGSAMGDGARYMAGVTIRRLGEHGFWDRARRDSPVSRSSDLPSVLSCG